VDPVMAAGDGDVLVIDNAGHLDENCWGEIMTYACLQRGVRGVAADGAVRDVDVVKTLHFPVYARGRVPLTARGRTMQDSYNCLIRFGGVQVRPGDIIIAFHEHGFRSNGLTGVIDILNQAYGFVQTPTHAHPMTAPQANAMAAIIEPLMSGTGAPWVLLAIGAIISILVNWLKISPLAFALGMFIPLDLNTPLVVGGLLNHWFTKSTKNEKLANSRIQRGTLIASGFIAGAALFGVIGAFIIFFTGKTEVLNLKVWSDETSVGPQLTAIIAFLVLVGYFVWDSFRAKPDQE